MRYIQTDETGRIIAHTEADSNPDENLWVEFDLPEEHLEDFNDYLFQDDQLVYDQREYSEEEIEEMRDNEIRANIPSIVMDTDAAICELYETQEQALADTDAALCELYELIIGGDE